MRIRSDGRGVFGVRAGKQLPGEIEDRLPLAVLQVLVLEQSLLVFGTGTVTAIETVVVGGD